MALCAGLASVGALHHITEQVRPHGFGGALHHISERVSVETGPSER